MVIKKRSFRSAAGADNNQADDCSSSSCSSSLQHRVSMLREMVRRSRERSPTKDESDKVESHNNNNNNNNSELPTWSSVSSSAATTTTYPQTPTSDEEPADHNALSSIRNSSSSSPIISTDKQRKSTTATTSTPLISSAVLLEILLFGFLLVCLARRSLQSSDDEMAALILLRENSNNRVHQFESSIRRLSKDFSTAASSHSIIEEEQQKPSKKNKNNNKNDPESVFGEPVLDVGSPSTESVVDVFSDTYDGPVIEELNLLRSKIKELNQQADSLKERVQSISRKETIEKYGSGTHRVQIELAFPTEGSVVDGGNKNGGSHTFTIELAPIDLMPHSVHFFLEMVTNGLLDGSSFILSALHVLKAAPLPYGGGSSGAMVRAFHDHGLESVAFKEYNDKYPHTQYTVGFAADGSPAFYINTRDNTRIHAGDPCFGKVVQGIDAIKRLEMMPTRNGIWLEQRVGIKKATLLPNSTSSN